MGIEMIKRLIDPSLIHFLHQIKLHMDKLHQEKIEKEPAFMLSMIAESKRVRWYIFTGLIQVFSFDVFQQ